MESSIFLHFIIISNIQHEKDPAVNVYQDLLWPCSVECFHAKMFRCKAINFWSEFSPSAGWAGLLEKVKLWGKAHRKVVSFKKIQFFAVLLWDAVKRILQIRRGWQMERMYWKYSNFLIWWLMTKIADTALHCLQTTQWHMGLHKFPYG